VTETNAPPPTPTPPHPQDQAGIHRRLVHGIAGKTFGTVINFGEQILLVPLFLAFWTPAQYGDWLVLLSTAGFIAILDFGLRTYFGNSLQGALSRGEKENFLQLLRYGTFFYTIVIAVGSVIALTLSYNVAWPTLLNLKTLSTLSSTHVLVLLSAFFLLTLPFGFISSIYRAYGEYAISVMVSNLMRIGLLAAIATMLVLGASITSLAFVYAVIAGVTWALVVIHQKRRYPDLKFGISIPDKAAFKETLSIGLAYTIVPVATALSVHGTILLISSIASSGATIAAYNTIRTLTGFAKYVSDQFLQVFGVEGARQYAQQDWAGLARLYNFITRIAGCSCGTLGGFVAVIGPPFFSLWTVGKIEFSEAVFWPLLGATVFASPSLAGVAVLSFINKPKGMVTAHISGGLAVVGLCLVLIPQFGAAGAAWAVFVTEVCLLSVIVPIHATGIIKEKPLGKILQGQFFAAMTFCVSAAIAKLALQLSGDPDLFGILIASVFWVFAITAPLYFLAFGKSERAWINDKISRLISRQ
jgi:O-antigen/teichoic acid export membrane protein